MVDEAQTRLAFAEVTGTGLRRFESLEGPYPWSSILW